MKTNIIIIFVLLSSTLFGQINADHLTIGEEAPIITGIDQNGKEINSANILKKEKILLIFYRGNWCPHCKKHLSSLEAHLQEFQKKGVFVIVVSPENTERTEQTGDMYNNAFAILHDRDNKIMSDYKVAFEVTKETVPNYYEKITKRLADYNNDANVLPVPATYLIDTSGIITYVHYDPDYKNRSDLSEILKSL